MFQEKPIHINRDEIKKDFVELNINVPLYPPPFSQKKRAKKLESGKYYEFCFLAVDVIDSTSLYDKFPTKDIHKTLTQLREMVKGIVSSYGGEEWDWAGDGGIYAFHLEKIDEPSIENAVYSAKSILDTLNSFNQSSHNTLSFKGERYHIRLRMGIDTGRAVYHEDPGERRGQALNYAVKIQKRSAPDSILITHDVFKELSDEAKSRFKETGITFKGKLSFKSDPSFFKPAFCLI